MKKAALFTLGLFVATQSYAQSDSATRAKGIVKVTGGVGLAAYSLLTLKHSFLNFRASRSASPANQITWLKTWIPVPTVLMPAQDKQAQRELSRYQLGTTGFAALLAKQLYDSGMKDLKQASI